MPPDAKIAFYAAHRIRKCAKKKELWCATVIEVLPPDIQILLDETEQPIVSASFPEGDWYVWTTKRMVATTAGQTWEVPADSIDRIDWGTPLKSLHTLYQTGCVKSTLGIFESSKGFSFPVRYETGYAWSGLVGCHQYWRLKHPILDKLMTPEEFEARGIKSI